MLDDAIPLTRASVDDNVFSHFADRAARTPEAVAVIDASGSTTYAQLAMRADAVARHLLAQGVGAGQPVGVLMHRRSDLLAVLLGIWKAGAAYVPCDPQDPPDRIRRILTSSDSWLVVADPPLLQALLSEYEGRADSPPRSIDPSTIPNAPTGSVDLPCAPGGAALAYLLFTSGSTGEPKAVEVEHRHVLALLQSASAMLKLTPGDRYLAASTIAFDASITELFLPLVTGASLLLRDRSILLDPRRLASDVREHGVSVVQTGPAVWTVLLAEAPNFPRVRVAITHGEAVAPDMARRLSAYGEEVWNLYGPTETTVWATGHRLSPDMASPLSAMSAPIGRPLAHVSVHVVDERGQPVADGAEGELWLGGPSIARGYRANAELTRERFVEIAGERVYRTGDIVVRDSAGVLHYFGRNDEQMKVRGVRVEPGEVETAILRDARVAQAAVTWFATRSGTKTIVAAVVLQPSVSCRAQDLHESLTGRLPLTMIPARFLFVPWLPMTTSGKIDRKAIRDAAAADAAAAEGARAAPVAKGRALTDTERAIGEVWQRILGVPSVAPDDHFFSIGGDSLAAVQMLVEVEGRFRLVLPVHLAFEAPTLEALAKRVERAQQQTDPDFGMECIYPLAPSGQGPPVFFCNADVSLARSGEWPLPCPLYTITYWGKGSGFLRAPSLQALAADYVEKVRRIQSRGPYRIAGFSMGGLIAFEMAQQLRAAGEEIELLFLLDPLAPLSGAEPMLENDLLSTRLASRIKRLLQGPAALGWTRWLLLFVPVPPSLKEWWSYFCLDQYLRRPGIFPRVLVPRDRWGAFAFVSRRLAKSYTARPFDGRTVAVLCRQGSRGEAWKLLLRAGHTRHELDIAHDDLFKDHERQRWLALLSEALLDSRQRTAMSRSAEL